MEVMMINVINSIFETATYVEQGVEILDAFMHLSAREVNYFKVILQNKGRLIEY